jgi:hypothetical protein
VLINYRSAGRRTDDATMFSSLPHGDPATPLLRAGMRVFDAPQGDLRPLG